jgi:hypothetical protein
MAPTVERAQPWCIRQAVSIALAEGRQTRTVTLRGRKRPTALGVASGTRSFGDRRKLWYSLQRKCAAQLQRSESLPALPTV